MPLTSDVPDRYAISISHIDIPIIPCHSGAIPPRRSCSPHTHPHLSLKSLKAPNGQRVSQQVPT
jgi:hypothetical protein